MHLRNVFSSGGVGGRGNYQGFRGSSKPRVSAGCSTNPQAALPLLIAESAPAGKNLMVRLIINLLAEPSG